MKAAHGRLAALNTRGRARRGALVGVLSTAAVAIGLIAAPAASAWDGGGCPSGAAAIHVVGYTVNAVPQPTLRGHVTGGSAVTATFTIDARCKNVAVQVNLPSYFAHSAAFDPNDTQQLADPGTGGSFSADGMQHTIATTVPAPPCFFQVDFVRGPVLNVGPNNHYGANLVDAANGGTLACV